MFLQLVSTVMGKKFVPPCACLRFGYSEETILFLQLLPLHFTSNECKYVS